MSSVNKGKFFFPLKSDDDDQKLFVGNEKICVVSVIGKSTYDDNNCKAAPVDRLLHRLVFQSSVIDNDDDDHTNQKPIIEGYYDAQNRIVYLHMIGVYDTHYLVSVCRDMAEELELKGFLNSLARMKYSLAKALLFLFSVSHIILIAHPVMTFDVSYVHLFRTIDCIRQKAQPQLSEVLKDFSLSNDWIQAGRPCSPRALFVFQSPKYESWEDKTRNIPGIRQSRKVPPIKKLEHALEDQIYRILRKSRVITNISMNSLFAIPANQEFVFVHTCEGQATDPVSYLLNQLYEQCLISLEDSSISKKNDYVENGGADDLGFSSMKSSFVNKENDHSFKAFLWQHVDLAFTKGFDDNVGRHLGMSVFELPTCKTWFAVATSVYKFFHADEESSANSNDTLSALKSQIDVDGRFSEARCLKVLPLATATYQEGLPSHYSSDVHHSQLLQAYRMFALHARGPTFEHYALQLHEECEKFWKNGHQLCEVHSLTGNPCVKPIHRLPTEVGDNDSSDGRISLPVMPHWSQVKITSACNCGRKQASRDDPFDAKIANYDFYEQLARTCCNQLEEYKFPVFQPSTNDFKAATIEVTQWINTPSNQKKDEDRELSVAPAMSLGLSLGQSLGTSGETSENLSLHPDPSPLPPETTKEDTMQSMLELSAPSSDTDKEDKVLIRQVSTTEYLPGMLHSESPFGLLPSFQSWSLICLGPSSLYSHNIGIQDQPGFISGTNFLLPWDVTVKIEAQNKWPAVVDTSGKKVPPSKTKKSGRGCSEFTVKIFLGIEYECPRGNRFMCCGPDKILKATGSGLIKENASKITSCDMPLYYPCPCRPGKPVMAQLMRIHIVTPKAPVHVTLDPKVQPAPPPCPIFYPGNQEPVKLSQSTYWVFRLPFIYEGEHGSYSQMKEKKSPHYGKLLKNVFGVLHVL